MMDGSPPASACAAVKGMAERTRADPPLKKRIGEDIMHNLDQAHARRALPMNHAAKSLRFPLSSITGSALGRRSCWRGWGSGTPAPTRSLFEHVAAHHSLDRPWCTTPSYTPRQVKTSHQPG